MIDDVMPKARSMVVFNVCSCLILRDITVKIPPKTYGLQIACYSKGVTFADSTLLFYLRDGNIIYGYVQGDGVHLPYGATNKLIQLLQFPMKIMTNVTCTQTQYKS